MKATSRMPGKLNRTARASAAAASCSGDRRDRIGNRRLRGEVDVQHAAAHHQGPHGGRRREQRRLPCRAGPSSTASTSSRASRSASRCRGSSRASATSRAGFPGAAWVVVEGKNSTRRTRPGDGTRNTTRESANRARNAAPATAGRPRTRSAASILILSITGTPCALEARDERDDAIVQALGDVLQVRGIATATPPRRGS